MKDWKNNADPIYYEKLNKHVDFNRCFVGEANELLALVRMILPYNVALLFMELLFRFPYVQRDYNCLQGKISLAIKIDLTKDYVLADLA